MNSVLLILAYCCRNIVSILEPCSVKRRRCVLSSNDTFVMIITVSDICSMFETHILCGITLSLHCCVSGEGLYQVLETVESGLLAPDDTADVSQQELVTSDPGMYPAVAMVAMTLFNVI